MDIAGPIIVVIICIIIFSVCGWCCKRKKEGTVYGYGPAVTVTTTQPGPQQPPYPVQPGMPPAGYGGGSPYQPTMPMQPGYPPNSGSPYPPNSGGPYPPNSAPYPQGPYPPGPAPGGYPPAGYPPQPQPGFQPHPPPYDVAVSMPPGHPGHPAPPQTEAYGKQAPYNPNY